MDHRKDIASLKQHKMSFIPRVTSGEGMWSMEYTNIPGTINISAFYNRASLRKKNICSII
jgi:hypothetical protein